MRFKTFVAAALLAAALMTLTASTSEAKGKHVNMRDLFHVNVYSFNEPNGPYETTETTNDRSTAEAHAAKWNKQYSGKYVFKVKKAH